MVIVPFIALDLPTRHPARPVLAIVLEDPIVTPPDRDWET